MVDITLIKAMYFMIFDFVRFSLSSALSSIDFKQFKTFFDDHIPERDLEGLFLLYDQDKNGTISWVEFVCLSSITTQGTFLQKVNAIFTGIDKDGNGEITKEELQTAYKLFGVDGARDMEYLKKVWDKCDPDNSGTLTLEEFVTFARKEPDLFIQLLGMFCH